MDRREAKAGPGLRPSGRRSTAGGELGLGSEASSTADLTVGISRPPASERRYVQAGPQAGPSPPARLQLARDFAWMPARKAPCFGTKGSLRLDGLRNCR